MSIFSVLKRTRGLTLLIRAFIAVLRPLIWTLGLVYLLTEAREMFDLHQYTSIAIFTVFILVASFQMRVSLLLMRLKNQYAIDAYRAGMFMFVASLFSMFDAAIDFCIKSLQGDFTEILLAPLFVIGWLVNLSSVILALLSVEVFIKIISISLLKDLRNVSAETSG
ncbi:MAG: hypothetical protein AB8A30_05525 [Prochlorococcus sp.]|jgi:hypothetical protein|nr:hypothetical protein [Prochlorococcaceae cyanobacterium ETNP14_MAG_4]|tara:strand:- start:2124 stop:2621 length:498 start_codon:yes stop_codon:yes gene_type:complete